MDAAPLGAGTEQGSRGSRLWRRVPPWHFPKYPGHDFPNSAAFADDPDGSPMSVVLVEVLLRGGRGPAEVLKGHEDYALAEITIASVEAEGCVVEAHPLPDEPAHALVLGKKTQGARKRIAKSAVWIVAPPVPPAGIAPPFSSAD